MRRWLIGFTTAVAVGLPAGLAAADPPILLPAPTPSAVTPPLAVYRPIQHPNA